MIAQMACRGLAKGAYVLLDTDKYTGRHPHRPGLSVQFVVGSGQVGRARIGAGVSMPVGSFFEQQSEEYRDLVLPPAVKARWLSKPVSMGWDAAVEPQVWSLAWNISALRPPTRRYTAPWLHHR
jgi:transketolase